MSDSSGFRPALVYDRDCYEDGWEAHMIPQRERASHSLSLRCECKPHLNPQPYAEGEIVVVHHSFSGVEMGLCREIGCKHASDASESS